MQDLRITVIELKEPRLHYRAYWTLPWGGVEKETLGEMGPTEEAAVNKLVVLISNEMRKQKVTMVKEVEIQVPPERWLSG